MRFIILLVCIFDELEVFGNLDSIAVSRAVSVEVESCQSYVPQIEKYFKIVTQNIQSIGCNFDNFALLLERTKIVCDIIILTECWLSCNPNIPTLDNYIGYTNKKCLNQNDGVAVYVKNGLGFTDEEPNFTGASCLVLKKGVELAIIALYRSPSRDNNPDSFINSLQQVLETVVTFKTVVIMGDINFDISTSNMDTHTEKYLNLTAFYGLMPAHNLITRPVSKTCIDHAILKTKKPALTLVIQSDITDHSSVLLCLNFDSTSQPKTKTYSKLNNSNLNKDMIDTDFSFIYDIDDPNVATNRLLEILTKLHNKK